MSKLSALIREKSISLFRNVDDSSLRLVYEEGESLYVMPSAPYIESPLQAVSLDNLTQEEQLLHAITSDNLPKVQDLLREGVDVRISHDTTVCQFQTRLHRMMLVGKYRAGFLAWALLLGNLEIAQVLIDNGATLDENTAMQVMRIVFYRGDFDALDFILKLPNIDINMSTIIYYSDDSYHLGNSCLYFSKPLLNELCEIFSESLDFLSDSIHSLSDQFVGHAQYKKNIIQNLPCLLKALLERKADVNMTDDEKKVPLDYIINKCSILLLENLCDDAFQFLELLLQNGINVNHVNFSGKTFIKKIVNSFLKTAPGNNHNPIDNFCRIVQLLLSHGAVIEQRQQVKLLALAVNHRIPQIMQLLQEECGMNLDNNIPGLELNVLSLFVQELLKAHSNVNIQNALNSIQFLITIGVNPHAIGVPREIDLPYRERQLSTQELSVFTLLMRHAQLRTFWNEWWGDEDNEISQQSPSSSAMAGKEEELFNQQNTSSSTMAGKEEEFQAEENRSHLGSMKKSFLEWLVEDVNTDVIEFIKLNDGKVEKTVYRGQAMALAASMSTSGIFNSAPHQTAQPVATPPSFTP